MTADESYTEYVQHRPRSETPEFDGLLERYEREESEAQIAYQAHDIVSGAEALLREASEG